MIRIISENDVSTCGGIRYFELAIGDDVVPPVTLNVVPTSVHEDAVSFEVEPGQTVQIGIHTHMLPEGQQEIRFELTVQGNRIAAIERQFPVSMRSPLANKIADILRGNKTPLIFEGPCDSQYYPYRDPEASAWFDGAIPQAHIDAKLVEGEIADHEADALRQFADQGYMVVENLVDEELVDAVNEEVDQAIAAGVGGYEYGSSSRIEHLHFTYPNIRKLWLHPALRRYASMIFDDRALPCQTLTFVFGSQQDAHQDTIHLTPFPAGHMCGIWIALQDIAQGSGELIVYPGSHREPRVYLHETGCSKVQNGDWTEFGNTVVPIWREMTSRYEEIVYRPKKGSVLFWHENLLHGGSLRSDRMLERRSMVIHAFSASAIVYYDSTGAAGVVQRQD